MFYCSYFLGRVSLIASWKSEGSMMQSEKPSEYIIMRWLPWNKSMSFPSPTCGSKLNITYATELFTQWNTTPGTMESVR